MTLLCLDDGVAPSGNGEYSEQILLSAGFTQPGLALMDAGIVTTVLSFLVVLWISFFIFTERKIPKSIPLLMGLSILVVIYILNPELRIYSFHGFRHAGIVYQLLQGNIPPPNPLLGGEVLQHPWGWQCVPALITLLFNITPFYSFALVNIVSLCLTMILIYHISRSVIEDEKANIFSVLIAIFAIAMLDKYFIEWLNSLIHRRIHYEQIGIPIFDNFSTINGVPLGLQCYLLSLCALIKLFKDRQPARAALVFLISILGCGFLYPAFLPGIIAGSALLCSVNLISLPRRGLARDMKKITFLIGTLAVGIVCLIPYFLSITSGIRSEVSFLNLHWMAVKTVSHSLVVVPLLVLIFISRRYFRSHADGTAMTVLSVMVIATSGCYIFTSLPHNTEVKYYMLSTVTLGIIGGIAFHALHQRGKTIVVFFLLLLSLTSLYGKVLFKISLWNNNPLVSELYKEQGKYLISKNSEANELYQWIRSSTGKNSIFIDVKLDIPVLAQRQLFIGVDKELEEQRLQWWGKDIYGGELGYTLTVDSYLRIVNGYDPVVIDKRKALVKRLYNPNHTLLDEEYKELLNACKEVYLVDRTKLFAKMPNREYFDPVFRSSQGHFLVYTLMNPPAPHLPSDRSDDAYPGSVRDKSENHPDSIRLRDVNRVENGGASPEREAHMMEAEDADILTSPLMVADDEDASGKGYIYTPKGTGSRYAPNRYMAVFDIYIAQGGSFVLWGRVRAKDQTDNSFYVQIDSGMDNLWEVEPGDYWHWDAVHNLAGADPAKFILTEGVHTIKVKLREDGTKLDRLLLTNDTSLDLS